MARAERALAILRRTLSGGERVLDLGCGAGFGTVKFSRYFDTYAVEPSLEYAQRARARAPRAAVTHGSAEHLPYPDDDFAAVLMLDVLEHVADERATIDEVARVLRPGGLLVLSVPNAGLFRWFDSFNLYMWLTGEDPWSRPGTPSTDATYHRHYSTCALKGLLGDRFTIEYTHYSGLFVAEVMHLAGLLFAKRLLRSRALYLALLFVYTGVYIVEDLIPFNRAGYHVMIVARRQIDAAPG